MLLAKSRDTAAIKATISALIRLSLRTRSASYTTNGTFIWYPPFSLLHLCDSGLTGTLDQSADVHARGG